MLPWLIWLAGPAFFLVGVWLLVRFWLGGPDLRRFDRPVDPPIPDRTEPSPYHHQLVAEIGAMTRAMEAGSRGDRLHELRRWLDEGFGGPPVTPAEIIPTSAGGVPAEWVVSTGSDPDRRLLYLHGGAFVAGSPKSHRRITCRLSELAGAAVLAVDYRLMPENKRQAGIEDCQTAYRWLIENGPRGSSPLRTLFVAGDSAGGNLGLMLLAWARDEGLRAAEGAVILSPGTDATFSSPSLGENLATDPMLGPMLRDFLKLPRSLRLLLFLVSSRKNPRDPQVSPVFGDLSGLPPVLVHASEAEVLRDDARRWVNKAKAAGTHATLETWPHVVHVWHAFAPDLPEAEEAYERIGAFLQRCSRREGGPPG